jgi:hypothetical protein
VRAIVRLWLDASASPTHLSLSLSLCVWGSRRGLASRRSCPTPLYGGWVAPCLYVCSAGWFSAERVGDARKPGGVRRANGVFPDTSSSGLRVLLSRGVRHRSYSRAVAFEEVASRAYPLRGVSVQCSVQGHGCVPNAWLCRGLSRVVLERCGGASPVPVRRSFSVVTVVSTPACRDRGSYVLRRGPAFDPSGSRRTSGVALSAHRLVRVVQVISRSGPSSDLWCVSDSACASLRAIPRPRRQGEPHTHE